MSNFAIDNNEINSASNTPRDYMVMTRGPHPGAKIALTMPRTILGDGGQRIVSVRQADFGYLVKAEDPTILVTHNGDPLPPVAKPIQNHDVLRFADVELICCVSDKEDTEL